LDKHSVNLFMITAFNQC